LSFNETEQQIIDIINRHPEAKQIIIFPPSIEWEASMIQRPQQLARFLAKNGALVFYMQPARRPVQFNEMEDRLVICQVPSDVFHIVPNAFVYALTWNIPLLAYFPSPHVIYDYLDDISSFQGERGRLQRDHGDYLVRADVVLTTSARLYKQVQKIRNDVSLCENGVDVEHFKQARQALPVPEDLKPIVKLGRPIIGHHGALTRWFDYELLEQIAKKNLHYEFVLIGSDQEQSLQVSKLLERENVHWLGPKLYAELPGYIAHFKVGIIPFKINNITNSMSPIKLFEYMAAGKAVVASPLEEIRKFDEVLTAISLEEWISQIEYALQIGTDVAFQERISLIGEKNSWNARALQIMDQLDDVDFTSRQNPWYWRLQPKGAFAQRALRLFARGLKVWRMSGFKGFIKGIYFKLYDQIYHLSRKKIFRYPRAFQETYLLEDNSQVTLYTNDPLLLPDYWPRQHLDQEEKIPRLGISVITTVYNEEENVVDWLTSILNQTLLPDEIVIVDAGSTDRTIALLNSAAAKSQVPICVLKKDKINIAAGRNIAIEQAENEIIASADFGCRLHKDWLENLTKPFRINPETDVVAGWYYALDKKGNFVPFKGWPELNKLDPQEFIPSSRSLAFTKTAWRKAGGYPEWLTLTGEDTFFAMELKRFCANWAFVPSAIVDWFAPETWPDMWKKARYWATGNGEAGIDVPLYIKTTNFILMVFLAGFSGIVLSIALLVKFIQGFEWALWGLVALVLSVMLMATITFYFKKISLGRFLAEMSQRIAQLDGFLKGARRKDKIEQKRLATTNGIVFILSGTQIDDTGGGARSTQIALEFLRQNYWVIYINRYPKWENQDADVRIAHPNLFSYKLNEFHWERFIKKYQHLLVNWKIHCIVEMPTRDFMPLIRNIKLAGGSIVYEMIDDWNSSLGGSWYSSAVEQELISMSDHLVATAPILKSKMETANGRRVQLLPNAVNGRLFSPSRRYKYPDDLPRAKWIAMYVGALWGDWFDWDLLLSVANSHPQSAVVVIGDYRGQCPDPPANLHFLGLKAQSTLPAYLSYADVAIIPWKVNDITQATSPLKLYEYLAMRKPVVVPDLKPLHQIPAVFCSRNTEEFVRLVGEVRNQELPLKKIDAFIAENNWQARVGQLIQLFNDKDGSQEFMLNR